MAETNQFFRPVGEFCQRSVISCQRSDTLVSATRTMRAHNISSIIVLDGDTPCGIFTDRDLRNKVVAQGRDPQQLGVADIMHAPLVTIGEHERIYDALYRMSHTGIHRLAVVNAAGELAGIITDSDILRLQSHSPHQLVLDIEQADSVAALARQHQRIVELVIHLAGSGIPIRETVKLIAHLNDQILIRLIKLLRAGEFADLGDRFVFVVMGSEGRSEQTLATDQDNAIIHADDLDATELSRLEAFANTLIEQLIAIGVPPCSGGIMARNPAWRRSLSAWKQELSRWLSSSTPENVMTGSMFMDLRALHGVRALADELRAHAYAHLAAEQGFLMRMAHNMTNFLPPLGWFGKVKMIKSGPHRGQLDLKKAGIFAITDGVKALAMEARQLEGSTHDRIEALLAAGVLKPALARDLLASYDFLIGMRLRSQVGALRAGRTPDNYLTLDSLNVIEQGELRLALEQVARFQSFIKHHFRLHLLRH